MHPRERVFAAIDHQRTDRMPAGYSAHKEVTDRLLARLGLADEEALLRALEIDFRYCGWYSYLPPNSEPDAEGYRRTGWGVRFHPDTGEVQVPFNEDTTVAEIEAHPWPSADALDYSGIRPWLAAHHDDYATVGAPWCPFFHEIGWLIGQEEYFLWMHEKPEELDALTRCMVDYEIEVTRRYLEAADGLLDIYYVGNDFGTQRGLFISPAQWERFLRPSLKRFYDLAHDFGCRVMQHSCGSVRAIIPALLEDGVEILDPIQIRAEGMTLESLVADFGDRLTFHGGVDTQHTLPFEDADAVRAQVHGFRALTRDRGGYILKASQDLITDIPDENILAMYELDLRV